MKTRVVCFAVLLVAITQGAFDFGRMLEGIFLGTSPRREAMEREAEESRERVELAIEEFNNKKSTLQPEEAAAEWLAVFDQAYPMVQTNSSYGYMRNDFFSKLVGAVPSPAAWPELERLVLERGEESARDILARIFAYRLVGKYDQLAEEMERLGEGGDGASSHGYEIDSDNARSIYLKMLPRVSRFQGREAEGFSQLLDVLERRPTADTAWPDDLVVPDLIKLVGPDATAVLIRRALALPALKLSVPSEGETLALVTKLAAEGIDAMTTPQWGLIRSADDAVLFELMDKRFPVTAKKAGNLFSATNYSLRMDYYRQSAMGVYLVGLIRGGQRERAIDYVLALAPEVLAEFGQLDRFAGNISHGSLADLTRFYEAVLEARPTAPCRIGLFKCILLSGNTERAIDGLIEELVPMDVDPEHAIGARIQLASLYLAVDDIDRALEIYEKLFSMKLEGRSEQALERLIELGKNAAHVGILLANEALIEKGLALTRSAGETLSEQTDDRSYISFGWKSTLIELMIELDHFADAEAFGQELLIAEEKKQRAQKNEYDFSFGRDELLVQMMYIYNTMGDHDQAIALLEESSLWSGADLAEVAWASYGNAENVLFEAATALNAVGRREEAAPLLEYHLYHSPSHDPAYRLLLDMKGAAASPFLDKLVERDRFEERPLIWKAVLLKESGKLEEAEKVVRAALALDPTDGEQRAGDRVRAYAVLSEILAARGNTKDAAFFEDVVKSVRIAELGDRMHEAGLVSRGLREYEKAEGFFADAYCVQWRLAERLYSMGRVDEARVHYEIAFTRLPEQFGRVASFCFGCEGVFEKEHTRGIAEQVLLDLEKTDSKRPQLHYLLGQLRMKQGAANAAYLHLETAVALDPDYLDAWEMLNDLASRVSVPPAERDAIQLKLLELDPLQNHVSVDVEDISNLSALWTALEKSEAYRVEPPENLFALPAAAAMRTRNDSSGFDYSVPGLSRDDDSPEQMIANDEIVKAIGALLDSLSQR